MSKPRGLFPLGAALGALLAFMAASEVKAGTFEITVSVLDKTTGVSTPFAPIADGSVNDTNPSSSIIDVSGAFTTAGPGGTPGGTGLYLTGLHSDFSSSSVGLGESVLNLRGIAQVVGTDATGKGLTDNYVVTVMATNTGFTVPTAGPALLGQSHSATYTDTTGIVNNGTSLQTYYDPTNKANGTSTFTPGTQTTVEPLNLVGPPLSRTGAPSPSTDLILAAAYQTPYSMTEIMTITITGNGSFSAPATTQFQSSATIVGNAIPEPSSILMFLTGMPMPLVILGILRRRKAQAKH
jgi:hypothetical protein